MVRKLIQFFGALYLFYIAVSVLLILPALNTLPHSFVKDTFDRELQTDIIFFNPLTFAVEVRNASLPERDGSPFFAVKQAGVDLSLGSLWQQGWVLDRVSVQELYLHVKQTEPGRFNFSELLEALPPSPPSEEASEPLSGLAINKLDLGAKRIRLTDQARDAPFSTHYDGLAVHVTDLSTIVEEGKPYKISALAESGGQLHWEGTVSIPRASSEGKLSLSKLSLAPLWRFAEPWLQLKLQQGQLNVSGNYKLNWDKNFRYAISDGQLSLNELSIVPKDLTFLPDTALALRALSVDGISLDSSTQHIDVPNVRLDSPEISGWMEGEKISLQALFAVSLPQKEPGEGLQTDATQPAVPWTATLGKARLSNGRIQWRSPYTQPQQILVSPVEAELSQLNWPLEGQSPVQLALTVNDEATLAINGAIALGPGEGTLKYRMEQLPLAWFNPNFPAALKAQITDGHAKVEGHITLSEFLPSVLQLTGAIDDFAGLLEGEENSMTSWNALRLKDLHVDLDKREISLARLVIDSYEGRVHIAKDGSVNASKVWQEEVGEQAGELVEELELNVPWQFDLPEIYVSDSAIDFQDESLPIPFRTVIGGLHGEVLGISSSPGAQTQVDMKGSVDGYAPVVLAGTAVPFGEPPAIDLKLTFNGVDLSLLTPYSGTYAGRAIERGLLNLELEYTLKNEHLQGDNKVLISQLKLGDKIESNKALDLPLDLALALLTDLNGVIDLEVPISGNVNDPDFGLGGTISQAFINLITKAVTAPFSLLASLVGAEQNLQRMNFSSGSAELGQSSIAKLDELTLALEQRPGLTLLINGRINREADLEALQTTALRGSLLAAGISLEQIKSREDAFLKAIETRYRKLQPSAELPTPPNQYKVVRASMTVRDDQLLELTQARAVAVKTYLVNDKGMAADRIAIEQTALDDEAHLFSGVELELDS